MTSLSRLNELRRPLVKSFDQLRLTDANFFGMRARYPPSACWVHRIG